VDKKELYHLLDYVNHSRAKRQEMANLVLANSQLVEPLLAIAFQVDDAISSRACWVLEFTAKEKLAYLHPHVSYFTAHLGKVHLDSSVRPIAKICEYLIISYFAKQPNKTQKVLRTKHLAQITTACFDWMISNQKVASQAYAMHCLYLLGNTFDWVHPELKMILEQHYAQGSAAYKARARMILSKIK